MQNEESISIDIDGIISHRKQQVDHFDVKQVTMQDSYQKADQNKGDLEYDLKE